VTLVALTIAGSDPSGGAGIQADLKAFHQFGVYGEAVVTLVTVQNTRSVMRVEVLAPDLVAAQIAAVVDDVPPSAAKLGALGNRAVLEAVAHQARGFEFPLVVDPVMISKHGMPLIADEARDALIAQLIPLAHLLTPNLHEASALTGREVDSLDSMKDAARQLRDLGARNVLIKGGHLDGPALDLLLASDGQFYEFSTSRIDTPNTHGTGCTYSAAITAGLAKGIPLRFAVQRAKQYVTEAIRTNPRLGHGHGPLNYFAPAPE
jgi:hydroxymethylpyrimidine/phosphomethylpyrimidine kinase